MSTLYTKSGWYMATDGKDHFHPNEIVRGREITTAQPHVIFKETEDALFAAVFDSPSRGEGDTYRVEDLTPKSEASILAEADRSRAEEYIRPVVPTPVLPPQAPEPDGGWVHP